MKKLLSILLAAALALSFTVPALASYETEPGGIAASGMALVDGALYIADSYNKVIWKSEGVEISLLAGRCDVKDSSGEPVGGYRDGSFSEASFMEPWGIAPWKGGLLVSDSGNGCLRWLDLEEGKVYTAIDSLSLPTGLAAGEDGCVYIADTGNGAVRLLKDGAVTTVAMADGASTWPVSPRSLLIAGGMVYVGDVFARLIFAWGTVLGFSDVAPDAWYYESVAYVSEQGLMKGVSDTEFAPGATLTRAMVWTILARLDGAVTDGGEAWYFMAQAWAMAEGVSDGTDPDGEITREQLVTMLWRFMGEPEVDFLLTASDAGSISAWACEAMRWAVSAGIIQGDGYGIYPTGTASRCEAAAIFMRTIEA